MVSVDLTPRRFLIFVLMMFFSSTIDSASSLAMMLYTPRANKEKLSGFLPEICLHKSKDTPWCACHELGQCASYIHSIRYVDDVLTR